MSPGALWALAIIHLSAFVALQVLYSPPLAQSACSVVSYRKLADINHGGIGSIFEVFEVSDRRQREEGEGGEGSYSMTDQSNTVYHRWDTVQQAEDHVRVRHTEAGGRADLPHHGTPGGCEQ